MAKVGPVRDAYDQADSLLLAADLLNTYLSLPWEAGMYPVGHPDGPQIHSSQDVQWEAPERSTHADRAVGVFAHSLWRLHRALDVTDAVIDAARSANPAGPISHGGCSGASWIELILDLGWNTCRLLHEPDSPGEIAARIEREADIRVDETTWPAIHRRLAAAKAWDHKWLFDGLTLESVAVERAKRKGLEQIPTADLPTEEKVALACTLRIRGVDLTDKELAERVGTSRNTLVTQPEYKRAKVVAKESGRDFRRRVKGCVDEDGNRDAWIED